MAGHFFAALALIAVFAAMFVDDERRVQLLLLALVQLGFAQVLA